MNKSFKALSTFLDTDTYSNKIIKKSLNDLPKNDILIKVKYSSLNYKDALSATGSKGVTKFYPHTPGIDAAGIIEESSISSFPKGTEVIVTGYDLGMNTPGGFSQYIRVPHSWVIKCPSKLSLKEAMMIGTAGITAGLSINTISQKLQIKNLHVLVSGASGGVGSLAVNILSSLGASVTAVTGKDTSHEFLESLGASHIISRSNFLKETKFPLNKGIYDAAIDVVGGNVLSSILAKMRYGGIVIACGNVSSPKFKTTVFPFILRGNSLIGIDSAEASLDEKESVWVNFSNKWGTTNLKKICKIVNLENLVPEIDKILIGKQKGRVVVKLW